VSAPEYLLDANVLSEPTRKAPNRGVLEGLRRHARRVATAAPVWYELLYGARCLPASQKRSEIEAYLFGIVARNVPILPYDEACAEWHSGEGARLRALGRPSPYADGQVAAIARVNDLVLVTANVKHYSQFLGLAVEDWRKP
jgi:tRNA(fMet)-specific endonuclease VapC